MLHLLPLLTCFLLCGSAIAAPLHYNINTLPTSVVLSWKVFGMGTSQADVKGITGRLDFYPQQDNNDRIEVNIPVRNIDAHNGILTNELKSTLFFDQPRYPTAAFTSTLVVPEGKDGYRVFGTLQIKAISHPIILTAKLIPQDDALTGERHLIFYADTAIDRSTFAMTRYIPLVSDRINIHIEVTIPDSAAPSAILAKSQATAVSR